MKSSLGAFKQNKASVVYRLWGGAVHEPQEVYAEFEVRVPMSIFLAEDPEFPSDALRGQKRQGSHSSWGKGVGDTTTYSLLCPLSP